MTEVEYITNTLSWIFKNGVSVLFIILGFLLMRIINKIDANQTALFNRMHDVEEDVNTLKGEHNVYKVLHTKGVHNE